MHLKCCIEEFLNEPKLQVWLHLNNFLMIIVEKKFQRKFKYLPLMTRWTSHTLTNQRKRYFIIKTFPFLLVTNDINS